MDGVPLLAVPDRLLVWGRAGVLGTVALGTGVVSHVAGGGRLPGFPGLVLLLAVSVLVAARFLMTRASTSRLVLLVVAGQTLTHAALSGLAGHRGASAGTTAHLHGTGAAATTTGAPDPSALLADPPRTGNLYDHYVAAVQTSAAGHGTAPAPGGWLTHQVEHLVEQGPLMVLAHLCGAVALGLFLSVGERSLWHLLLLVGARRAVGLAADRVLRQAAAVASGLRVPTAAPHDRLLPLSGSQVLATDARRLRAPPLLLAA